MAILVPTDHAASLLALIKKAVRDGVARTWEIDVDGDFVHTPTSGQYDERGWIRGVAEEGQLAFYLIARTGQEVTRPTYALFMGRFVTLLTSHFLEDLDITVTTGPVDADHHVT